MGFPNGQPYAGEGTDSSETAIQGVHQMVECGTEFKAGSGNAAKL